MTYSATVLADTPFSYYHLNEASGTTAADSSGNGHNGTYTGGAGVTYSQGTGIVDSGSNSVKLDGSTGYVSLPTTGIPTGNSHWSLEAWINIAANPSATALVVGFGQPVSHEEAVIYLDTGGHLRAGTFNGDTTGGSTLSKNAWHQVVATWDGTTITAYLDGAIYGSAFTPGNMTIPSSGNANNIGRNTSGTAFWFPGKVQEVSQYAATLSAAQVLAHYNAGITDFGSPTLVANSVLTESAAQLVAPAALAGNAALTVAAQVVAPATLISNSALAETGQVVAPASLASNGVLSVAAAQLLANGQALIANSVLTASAQNVASAALAGNTALTVAAQMVALAALVANTALAESAQLVGSADTLSGNSVLAATGVKATEPGSVALSAVSLGAVALSAVSLGTVTLAAVVAEAVGG